MESYRFHDSTINSISFIRKSLAEVPQPPPVVPPTQEDVPRDDLLSSDEEDNKESTANVAKHNLDTVTSPIGSFLYYSAGRRHPLLRKLED